MGKGMLSVCSAILAGMVVLLWGTVGIGEAQVGPIHPNKPNSRPSHSGAGWGAWDSYVKCNGTPLPVVYLPDVSGVSGCELSGAANPYSRATQSIAKIAAHEWAEAVTDSLDNAWYDPTGHEIGDKCLWQ